MKGVPWREEAGFTLVEILVAVAIIMIALVAVIQWFAIGTQGMDTGKKQSTAVFLGEQKLEQIKAWALSTGAGQGFATVDPGGTCRNVPNPCADDNPNFNSVNPIPGYPEYSRTVIIACLNTTVVPATVVAPPCPATSTARRVQVQVGYRRTHEGGVQGGVFTRDALNQVELATIIAQH